MLKDLKAYLKTNYPDLFSFYRSSRQRAKWWARNSKRLDLCAAQFAYMMHYTGNQFKDSVCLEIGAGWVLSHAIVAYLLGAQKVYATDYLQLADLSALSLAIRYSDPALIRDILAPYEDHEILRERIEAIKHIPKWSSTQLERLGVLYTAPVDLTKKMDFKDVDFAYSLSVLEHIPAEDIETLVKQLSIIPNQFHFIHLEDHADLANAPFEFLGLSHYPKQLQLERGNRVRASQWIQMLSQYHNVETVHAWKRRDVTLPKCVDSKIIFEDDDDLITSHLGVFLRKD